MTDFIVIGGGIAGISAGARLSHLGRVTVLERESGLAYHASGRSAALYEAAYGRPPVIALNHASRDYLAAANGGVLSPRGMLLVSDDAGRDRFEDDLSHMALDRIGADEARALWPVLNGRVTMAAHTGDAMDIDTDRLIQNFAREIRENGGSVITGAEVTAIRKTGSGWAVTAAGETHAARVLVNASGAWADVVAAMAGLPPIGFQPYRRSMARIPAPGGRDVSAWPMVFGPGEDWYSKPDAGALIVSPAEEHPTDPHDAWADDMVLAEGLARYEAYMTEPVTRMIANWAGLRTFSPDRVLVLGPDPLDPSFVWSAGQGGYGFQTSPAASRLVADLVGGMQSELDPAMVAALRPDRLR